jgi:hypothetical protein
MAHLWIRDDTGEWVALILEASLFQLNGAMPKRLGMAADVDRTKALLMSTTEGSVHRWVLVAGQKATLRVNGLLPSSGIRVLSDRDQIQLNGNTLFFSTESLATVVPFPGTGRMLICPRCQEEILKDTPAVRCPNPQCGVWYHQREDRPCWTYAPCSLCENPGDLDAGCRWSPEEV